VLASGSSGNCALLATDRTRILVDAGLSFKALVRRLESVGELVEPLHAVLVTHEHSDHVSGLARLARRLGIPVYISKLTAPAVDWGEIRPRLECFQAGASFTVGDIDVDSFASMPKTSKSPSPRISATSPSPSNSICGAPT
jgi:glyoxylase-like metal-dependent hydrolase (beta-lactamase superfamily II)